MRGDVVYQATYQEVLRSRPEQFPMIGGENAFLVKNAGIEPETEVITRKPDQPILLWKDLQPRKVRKTQQTYAP